MTRLILDGDPLVFRTAWNKNSEEEAYDAFMEKLDDVKDAVFSIECKIAVYGDNNFRIKFYPDYKNVASRKKAKENNPYFMDVRNRLVAEGVAISADGMEADDLVRIWAEEARREGIQYVIASVDKDLQCIPGPHYLIHKDEIINVSEDEADIHYWTQVLTGDSTDNIEGLRGIGPKKATKILEGAADSKERKQRVIDAYHTKHGDEWKDKLMHTGTLIHIMRAPDDMFKLRDEDGPSE